MRSLVLVLTSFCTSTSAFCTDLRVSGIFSDDMVLQREQPASVWGWVDQKQTVTVEFAGQSVAATASDAGLWQVTLQPMKSNGTGRDLTVRSGGQQVLIRDVVVGDVWHASGQSNMAMTLAAVVRGLPEAREHMAGATLPAIRFRRINENESPKTLDDLPINAGWRICSPENAAGFSAVAFYFARKLHKQLGVPIGMIDSSRGGTPIEPYIPRAAFHSHPTLRRELELGDRGDLRGIWKLAGGVRARDAHWLPGRLFHSRLAPVTRLAVRGVIWYQGESNCGDGEDPREYQHKMRALITGWREAFNQESLSFYFVQLPGSGAGDDWPFLREQQRLSGDLPRTGMVVTIDLLDDDIHPPNKVDVGERLARWALAREHGQQIPYSGPMYERVELADSQATVHFSHAESGLMIAIKNGLAPPRASPQTKLSHFELADQNGQWHPAEAVIRDRFVVVRSDDLPDPVAVRYAYAVDPQHCHLYSRDGLPASPFCSHPELLRYQPDLPVD